MKKNEIIEIFMTHVNKTISARSLVTNFVGFEIDNMTLNNQTLVVSQQLFRCVLTHSVKHLNKSHFETELLIKLRWFLLADVQNGDNYLIKYIQKNYEPDQEFAEGFFPTMLFFVDVRVCVCVFLLRIVSEMFAVAV